jgi:hypothetical protein
MRAQGAVPKWLREQSAKLRCSGSTPLGASKPSFARAGGYSGVAFFVIARDKPLQHFPFCSHVCNGSLIGTPSLAISSLPL